MEKPLGCLLVLSMLWATPARAEERILHHDVYFKLKDNSAQAKAKFIAACKQYLTDHPGMVWFAVGEKAEGFQREVNDRDFDVVLQIIFTGKAAHDAYMKAERHLKFIEETKPNWEKVRGFDWYAKSLAGIAAGPESGGEGFPHRRQDSDPCLRGSASDVPA